MAENKSLAEVLKTSKPAQVIQSPAVADRFLDLYMKVNGIDNVKTAEAFLKAEQFHFGKLIASNAKVASCTNVSIYGIFMDVAVMGLSFDPSMKHLYVVPYFDRNENRNVAQLQISGQGELVLRAKQGQIKYADNPVIVWSCDEFDSGSRDGQPFVEHVRVLPRPDNSFIVACYIRIVRSNGSTDYKVLTYDELMQLRKSSKDPNSTAWTTHIAGMMMAKTIKHAFKAYPKTRVAGNFSRLQTEIDDDREIPEDIYGIDMETGEVVEEAQVTEATEEPKEAEPKTVKNTLNEEPEF